MLNSTVREINQLGVRYIVRSYAQAHGDEVRQSLPDARSARKKRRQRRRRNLRGGAPPKNALRADQVDPHQWVRCLLSEFGIVLPLRADNIRRRARAACEQLPAWPSRAVGDLLDHIITLDQRIDEYDIHLQQLALADERSKRLMQLRGVGPMTATALLSSIGNGQVQE